MDCNLSDRFSGWRGEKYWLWGKSMKFSLQLLKNLKGIKEISRNFQVLGLIGEKII